MTENQAPKAPKREYVQYAPTCDFNNQLDYTYGFTFEKATDKANGIKFQVVIPGFDMAKLSDSESWMDFKEYCQKLNTSPQGICHGFQANRGTKPRYAEVITGLDLEAARKACQTAADEYQEGQRASGPGKVKVTAEEAANAKALTDLASTTGMSIADMLALIQKKAKK